MSEDGDEDFSDQDQPPEVEKSAPKKKEILKNLFGDEDEPVEDREIDEIEERSDEEKKSDKLSDEDEPQINQPKTKASNRSSLDEENVEEMENENEAEEEEDNEGIVGEELNAIPVPELPREKKVYYIKLPNILGIQSKPFDKNTYNGDDLQPTEKQGEGSIRNRHKTENVVRWRYAKDDNGKTIVSRSSCFVFSSM
eukprot:TRINITY_DN1890_c0_g1_i1.p2 TRINITY_DN1890_c0_g1~~TRINITY_DN1890_c0_g1_i1.p2  ORF type:complete len:197 (-),score=59.41 TRINITY_DN1890_c0_g1_i1:628-1218(-)